MTRSTEHDGPQTRPHDVVIVGGGNAGVSLAAKLRRDGLERVALVDGQQVHRYRPMLNYAAAGQADMERFERPMRAVIPDGVTWVPEFAAAVDPDAGEVATESGLRVRGRHLVLCPGLTPRWEATPGLREAYAAGWAVSAHVPEYIGATSAALAGVGRGDHVVFSVPPEPASCGGTVLKAMFLMLDAWRRAGVLDDMHVRLVTPYAGLLDRPETLEGALASAVGEYGVRVHRGAVVERVDASAGVVTLSTGERLAGVSLAYVTPEHQAPAFIREAGLDDGGAAGLADVDPLTMRHRRHPGVWALGDAAQLQTRPSGGALRRQVKILSQNIAAADAGRPLQEYDGYTVIPVAVSRDELVLDEHVRGGAESRSIPGVDMTKPRRATYAFDRYGQPRIYWNRLLKGKV